MTPKAKVTLILVVITLVLQAVSPAYLPAYLGALMILSFVKYQLRRFVVHMAHKAQEKQALHIKQARAERRKEIARQKANEAKKLPLPMPVPTPSYDLTPSGMTRRAK